MRRKVRSDLGGGATVKEEERRFIAILAGGGLVFRSGSKKGSGGVDVEGSTSLSRGARSAAVVVDDLM